MRVKAPTCELGWPCFRLWHGFSAIPFLLIVVLTCACQSRPDLNWVDLKTEIRSQFPEVQQLSTSQLADWLDSERQPIPLLIDARSVEEFEVSQLQGARRAGSIKEALSILGESSLDLPVVVYCSVGYRSSRLAMQLQEAGFRDVYNLEGSIFEWANEGRPVFQGRQEVHKVHPYDTDWGRLLERSYWPE